MALAEHFRRGGEPARAVRWYERAAAQALRANDLGAAIERAEMGMASGATAEAAGALRLIQAEAHVWRGELDEAERTRSRRRRCWRRAAPPGSAPRAQAIIAAGKHGRLDVVERQVALAGETPRAPDATARNAQMICLSWAANYLVFGGRIDAADALMRSHRRGWRATPRRIEPQALALVHQVRAARASAAGDLGRCLGGLESALQAFEQAGDLRNACAVRANLGYLYCELGDFQRAEAALRQALGAADRMGLHDLTAAVLHNLGRVLGPARRARRGRAAGTARRSTTSGGRAIRAWKARRARTWPRS